MAGFTVQYWFGEDTSGQRAAYVSEGMEAASVEEATEQVQQKMQQPFFAIDADAHGRVLINRGAVRFCAIRPAQSAEEAEAQARLLGAAQASAALGAHHLEAAEQVDNDVRGF